MGSADCLPYHPRMDWLFSEVIYEPSLNSQVMGTSENGTVIQTTWWQLVVYSGTWQVSEYFGVHILRHLPVILFAFHALSIDIAVAIHHIPRWAQGFRCDFWLMLWGAACPKRTTCWSSSANIIKQLVSGLYYLNLQTQVSSFDLWGHLTIPLMLRIWARWQRRSRRSVLSRPLVGLPRWKFWGNQWSPKKKSISFSGFRWTAHRYR